jgi:predicted sulfurtransferase
MATLHIEHAISDLETWLGAFSRFEDARKGAGVRAQRVSQPIDDDEYIVVQLGFDTEEDAGQFKGFLESRIWSNPEASPALKGEPRARVLRDVTPS